MNTTAAIDCLRESDPCREGLAAPPIEPVLLRLGEDPGPPARPPRRPRAGAILGAAAALAAVVAVVATVGLVGRQRAGNEGAAGSKKVHVRPAPWQHGGLASQFGILRHPLIGQPIAVELARAIGLRPGGHEVVVGQLPVLRPRPGVSDHLLVVLRLAHGASPERLSLATVRSDGGAVFRHPLTSAYMPGDPMPSVGFGVIDSLVPDWVSQVRWSLALRPGGALRTIHPRIVHNIAYAFVPSYAPGSLTATWSGHGRTVGAAESQAVTQRDCAHSPNGCEVPPCRAGQLSARLIQRGPGAAGLYLSASGGTTCQMFGDPRLALRGRGGWRQVGIRPAASSSAPSLVQGSVHGTPGSIAVYALRPVWAVRCPALPGPLSLVIRLPRGGGELNVPVSAREGVDCSVR